MLVIQLAQLLLKKRNFHAPDAQYRHQGGSPCRLQLHQVLRAAAGQAETKTIDRLILAAGIQHYSGGAGLRCRQQQTSRVFGQQKLLIRAGQQQLR